MSRRVLITGSRTWTDLLTIRGALREVWGDGTTVLVSGACPRGADCLAEQVWRQWGGHVQRHPADWATVRAISRVPTQRRDGDHRRRGLPGIHPRQLGRGPHTARLAEAAGIPTRRYPHSP